MKLHIDRKLGRAKTRRLSATLIMTLSVTLAACGGDDAGDTADGGEDGSGDSGAATQMTMIHGSGPNTLPLFFQSILATELGFWDDEEIAVEEVALGGGSVSSTQQLVAGNGDIADPSPQTVFDGIEEGYGDEITIVGTWLYEQPFSVRTYPDSEVDSIEDLAGGVIGVSEAAGGEVPLLEATLELYGISDYELLPIGDGSAETVNALQERQVDAYSTSAKDFLQLLQQVDLKPVSVPEWEDLTANIFVVRSDYLEENREAVVGYLRGLAKASLFAYENLDAAIEITSDYQEEDLPEVLVEGWVEQTRDQSVPLELIEAGTPFQPAAEQLQTFLDFYKGAGAIADDVEIDLDEQIDPSVSDDAGEFDVEAIRELAQTYGASE